MKRSITATTAILLTAATLFSGCARSGNSGHERSDEDRKRGGETTVSFEPSVTGPDPAAAGEVNDPSIVANLAEPLEVNFVPADYGRIIPYTGSVTEDEWGTPEETYYVRGFVDTYGVPVCDPIFDDIRYVAEYDAYIVRASENGVSKYGFLSSNGAVFTGLIFDGASEVNDNRDNRACFYGTNYSDGKLTVTSLDNAFNALAQYNVTIDENAINIDAATAQLSVSNIYDNRAFVFNRDEFYPTYMLIDSNNGEVLYSTNALKVEKLVAYGNVIIEQDMGLEGLVVYDLNGEVILDDENAYSWLVCDGEYMVAREGKLSLYDEDWEVIDSMDIAKNAVVYTSFEKIAVSEKGKTSVYDKDLNLLTVQDNVTMADGSIEKDWYNYGEGDIYFTSFVGNERMYNLSTGASIDLDMDFYYSFCGGYIFADNISNGNDEVRKWMVFDGDFKPLANGTGYAITFVDEITGEAYFIASDAEKSVVYSIDGTVLFECDRNCTYMSAMGGVFYATVDDQWVMYDKDGKLLFEYAIEHTGGFQISH